MNLETVATLIEGASYVVSFCSLVAAVTPTPVDNVVLGVLRKVVDFCALNWGHAKNKEPGNA